jgi:hypothetical protein
MIFLLLAVSSTSAFSQGEAPKDAYQSAWAEVSELLRKREYASAIAKLDSLTEERDLRNYGQQIEADKKAIDGLQILERIVLEQAAKLEAGTSIEVSGIGYIVIRYEKSSKGDALVLKSNSLGRETRKPVADLPSGTWVELAEADLASLDNAPLTLGIFLAFDRVADRRAARKLFNEAASHGEDVTPWLARLDAEEAAKKAGVKGDDDPIVGKWSGGFGPKSMPATYEFRKNGTGVMTINAKLLDAMSPAPGQSRQQFEAARRLIQSMPFTWAKKESGTYHFTFKAGGTFDDISVEGDRLNLPGAANAWVRQASR